MAEEVPDVAEAEETEEIAEIEEAEITPTTKMGGTDEDPVTLTNLHLNPAPCTGNTESLVTFVPIHTTVPG